MSGKRTAAAQRAYRDRKRQLRQQLQRQVTTAELSVPLPLDGEAAAEAAKPELVPWYGKRESRWRHLALRMWGNPVEEWARIKNLPVEEIAAWLQCTLLEAFQVQERARIRYENLTMPRTPAELNVEAPGAGVAGFSINLRLGDDEGPAQGELLEGAAEEVLEDVD